MSLHPQNMGQEHSPPPNHSENSMSGSMDKDNGTAGADTADHLEVIRTVSRVPGNTRYYEKDGLRTYGGDEDHDHEPPVGIETYIQDFITKYVLTDDHKSIDVIGCDGFLMDGFANPSISLR